MAMDALVAPLARSSLFAGLTVTQQRALARAAERIVFAHGARINEEGATGSAAYLIVSGEALRVSGPGIRQTPERIGAGALVGAMAMLVDCVHGSTIVAEGPVRALTFTREALHRLMAEDSAIAAHFADHIRRHLAGLVVELRSIYRNLDGDLASGDAGGADKRRGTSEAGAAGGVNEAGITGRVNKVAA